MVVSGVLFGVKTPEVLSAPRSVFARGEHVDPLILAFIRQAPPLVGHVPRSRVAGE